MRAFGATAARPKKTRHLQFLYILVNTFFMDKQKKEGNLLDYEQLINVYTTGPPEECTPGFLSERLLPGSEKFVV